MIRSDSILIDSRSGRQAARDRPDKWCGRPAAAAPASRARSGSIAVPVTEGCRQLTASVAGGAPAPVLGELRYVIVTMRRGRPRESRNWLQKSRPRRAQRPVIGRRQALKTLAVHIVNVLEERLNAPGAANSAGSSPSVMGNGRSGRLGDTEIVLALPSEIEQGKEITQRSLART